MSRALRYSAPLAAAAVGVGAAVATAHGVYEVAGACGVPAAVAALYPLITDGLALVGYACALRLPRGHRRWAWAVVIAAAGLSGVAQATFLSGGLEQPPGWLRFGVGAWPAIAAALVAHLLFLMATSNGMADVHPPKSSLEDLVQSPSNPLDDGNSKDGLSGRAANSASRPTPGPMPAPAKERALHVARELCAYGDPLPTVNELAAAAGVARGTAATALRELRSHAGRSLPAARQPIQEGQ